METKTKKTDAELLQDTWESEAKYLLNMIKKWKDNNENEEENDFNEEFGKWLDSILEIKRYQYRGKEGWKTVYFTLVLWTGGPHIEMTTGGDLNVYWAGTLEGTLFDALYKFEEIYPTMADKDIINFLDFLFELLEEAQ